MTTAAPRKPRTPRVRKPKAETPAPAPKPEVVAPPAEAPVKPKRVRKPVAPKPEAPVTPDPDPLTLVVKPEQMEVVAPSLPIAAAPTDLSEDKAREDFARLERIVDQGLRAYIEVGTALGEIRARGLFKLDGFLTFEDYAEAKWDLSSRQRAHQIIEGAAVANALNAYWQGAPPVALPAVESHARGLVKLLPKPDVLADAWVKVVETAPLKHGTPHITGHHVEAVLRDVMGLTPNPGTGPGEAAPTPPSAPAPEKPQPPTETRPVDLEPAGVIAPPVGQAPDEDTLDHTPTLTPAEEVEVLTAGEKVVLTPQLALEKVIEGLKLGRYSHADPLIERLVLEVNAGAGAWLDSETDAVEWDDADTGEDEG